MNTVRDRSRNGSQSTVLVAVLLSVTWSARAQTLADESQSPSNARERNTECNTIQLQFLSQPAERISLRLLRDGEPISELWRHAFRSLFQFHDPDGDGVIQPSEAEHLPDPLEIHQLLWGEVAITSPMHPPWNQLDADRDSKLTEAELIRYYVTHDLGRPVIGIGEFAFGKQLTESLTRVLDNNSDGRLDRNECLAADRSLTPLDLNGDGLVGPGELVLDLVYPGTAGTTSLPPGAVDSANNALIARFPMTWTDSDTRHQAPDPASAAQQPRRPSADRKREPWTIHLSSDQTKTHQSFRWTRGGLSFELRPQVGELPTRWRAARDSIESTFRDADTDGNQVLEPAEIENTQKKPARDLVRKCDRNHDKRLTQNELAQWLDVRTSFVSAHVLVTVIDFGHGLFECLDVDHDGGLSKRERRHAWQSLAAANCIHGETVSPRAIPRQLLASVSSGHPRRFLEPFRRGPEWFVEMDRNQDGEVGLEEFPGTATQFSKLDRDEDQLIDAAEAESIDAR
jgi:Ca2+-binding EF-hand superfamily protein